MSAFSDAIAKFSQKAKANADAVLRETAKGVGERLVARTPVEEGEARGGWKSSINGFSAAPTGRDDKGGAATVEAIAAVIEHAKAGDSVFITNSLPHIMALEHGHSKQAPAGMVAVTAAEGSRIVADAVRRVVEGRKP